MFRRTKRRIVIGLLAAALAGGGAAVGGAEPRQSRPQDGLPCGPQPGGLY